MTTPLAGAVRALPDGSLVLTDPDPATLRDAFLVALRRLLARPAFREIWAADLAGTVDRFGNLGVGELHGCSWISVRCRGTLTVRIIPGSRDRVALPLLAHALGA